MEDKNVKQKEFWSGAGGDVWVNKQRGNGYYAQSAGTEGNR